MTTKKQTKKTAVKKDVAPVKKRTTTRKPRKSSALETPAAWPFPVSDKQEVKTNKVEAVAPKKSWWEALAFWR